MSDEQNSSAVLQLDDSEANWSRVAPIAMAYFFIKGLYLFVTNGLLYMLPVLVLQRDKILEHPIILGLVVIGIILFFLVMSVLRYFFYFYRLSGERVEVRHGVFKKSHLDLPFNKIQNVKIEQPFYYRYHKYATVELETAGSASQEAKIVALKLDVAEAFKRKILNIQDKQSSTSATATANSDNSTSTHHSDDEVVLNTRSIVDLVIHGITNNRVWIFLGAAAPFYQTIAEDIGDILLSFGFDIAAFLDFESLSMGMFLLHALSLVMIIMLLLVSLSVIASIFVFYNYQLSKHGDRYIRRSGLITKQEVSMKASRIQVATQQQDWLDIVIDRANVRLEQNSSGVPTANQAGQLSSPSKLIVPSVTRKESDFIIGDVFGVESLNAMHFTPVSKRLMLRYLIWPVGPILLILLAAFIAINPTLTGWLAYLGICCFVSFLAFMRWYRWGYCITEDYICVRRGMLGVDLSIFPKRKLQQAKFKQTIFMQKHQLASINFVLASGGQSIPYIPAQTVAEIIDESLLLVERDKPAWM
ncbi:PH domain-containing protein [Glaciecola sp. 1036]|uniref:PH domain-containing protein n=1 Tax=Alteromonadaceae TaxID=72275 RepID=UPI003D032F05